MISFPRELDPEVFGTPSNPLRLEAVPLENRAVSEDGESFTTTKNPGPFSNNVREITGNINIEVVDRTISDQCSRKLIKTSAHIYRCE